MLFILLFIIIHTLATVVLKSIMLFYFCPCCFFFVLSSISILIKMLLYQSNFASIHLILVVLLLQRDLFSDTVVLGVPCCYYYWFCITSPVALAQCVGIFIFIPPVSTLGLGKEPLPRNTLPWRPKTLVAIRDRRRSGVLAMHHFWSLCAPASGIHTWHCYTLYCYLSDFCH